MPKVKLKSFSEEWMNLFDWIEQNPDTPKSLVTKTEKQARTMRAEFYNARSALAKEPALDQHYEAVLHREVIIEPDEAGAMKVVTFRHKDRTPIAELIRRSLAEDNKPRPDGEDHSME